MEQTLADQDRACPFCAKGGPEVLFRNEHARAFRDGFPLAEGHTLVVPARHLRSVFDGSAAEVASVWALVAIVRADLQARFGPAGFTIGVNDGEAAGQTVAHGHVHVIPRFHGDVADPRGGIRWVVPRRAAYWAPDP